MCVCVCGQACVCLVCRSGDYIRLVVCSMPRDLEITFRIVSVFMCVPVCVPALVCVSED